MRRTPSATPDLLVLSERDATRYEPAGREACISITGPAKPLPALSDRFVAVLRLAFSDITEPIALNGYVLFNDDHAKAIVAFAHTWHHVDRLVIHCHAGLSRSPAIALAFCDLFAWDSASDLETRHPLWNTWVRGELVRIGRAALEHHPRAMRPDQIPNSKSENPKLRP